MSLLELVLVALHDGTLPMTGLALCNCQLGGVQIQIHDHSLVVKSSTVLKQLK